MTTGTEDLLQEYIELYDETNREPEKYGLANRIIALMEATEGRNDYGVRFRQLLTYSNDYVDRMHNRLG